jgi:hypothetical protein
MKIALKGSSPAALTAGILLLSRARSFGLPGVHVTIVGDPEGITPVLGPAVLHSTVLASCGVGRELGQGPLVVVPGAPGDELLVCLNPEGQGPWFGLDSLGAGAHPATQAFVRICRDPRHKARHLGKELRRFLAALGLPAEPALLDLMFMAPAPPLTRLALALRAGRAISGEVGQPVHRYLASDVGELPDPLPAGVTGEEVLERHARGELEPLLQRVALTARDSVEDFLEGMAALAASDQGRDMALVAELAHLAGHMLALPSQAMLPPPDSASDAVATGLARALGASQGERNASHKLLEVFTFLGGRFSSDEPHPICVHESPAPEDRVARWRWFVDGVWEASDRAEAVWREVMDRPA